MAVMTQQKEIHRQRRHQRIRARIRGTKERPRLAVWKSNRYMSAQLIDDDEGKTLVGMTTRSVSGNTTLSEKAHELGKRVAASAKKVGVHTVVFDRGGYMYTGNVKAFADGAREGGLAF